MEVEKDKNALRLGVDYLTLSKPHEEHVADVVREVAIALQTTGECCGWKHGYQGVKVCGGLGDVMSRNCPRPSSRRKRCRIEAVLIRTENGVHLPKS
jgi:hypothetical protein